MTDGQTDDAGAGGSDGVDYAWVMQTTFVVTIAVGAPLVAALSALVPLSEWESWVGFAVRVGALVWFLTAIAVYAYARRYDAGGEAAPEEDRARADTPTEE